VAFGRFRRVAKEWVAAALGLSALAVAAGVYFFESRPVTYRLTITAGSTRGLRHQIAEHLAAVVRGRGVVVSVVPTAGSEEALDRVNAGSLDLALVQGGLDASATPDVRQAASLRVEPLHLLVKAEIEPDAGEGRGLEFLRGRVVNLSEVGSGTHALAREVLAFAGLAVPGDYTPTTRAYGELLAEADRAKLPDAVFTVSALPSPLAKHLVTRRNFRLVPLRFGEAFALDSLPPRQGPSSPPPGVRGGLHGIDRVHVHNTEIPAYTYSVSPPVPPRPVPTFGTRLLLVAGKGVSAPAVARLLEGAYAGGPGGPTLDLALLTVPPEMDWHDGAVAYRDRNKPLIIGDAIDALEKGTSLAGALLGGLFFLWQWYRQRVRRRRELGFEASMLRVTEIERRALQTEMEVRFDLKELLQLEVELSRIKIDALQRFADGEFEGEQLISGFLTHVNDARDHLTRLILHERDNLEEQAARQSRTAEAVWYEAVGDLAHDPGGSPPQQADGRGVSGGEVIGP